MDDYPNPEEEFELQYGDELQMLAEQEDEELLNVQTAGPSVRKSLNFTTPNSKTNSQANKSSINNPQPSTSKQADLLENSFDTDFQQLVDTNNDRNPKKRGVEDLFGDIDDLLLEETTFVAKKAKTEDEKLADNLALIERIVEFRKLARRNDALNLSLTNNCKSVSSIDHIRNNLSYRVPRYPFIGVTRHDGERVYVRMHSEEYEKEDILRVTQSHSFTGIMGTASKDLWKGANEIINKNLDRQNETADVQLTEVQETDNSKLWVDMYKPKKYTDLLSDESTNRSLLKWLKLWDKVVFHRRPKIKPEWNKFNSKFPNKNQNFFQKKELDLTLDEHDRPQNKVALLCGPPGLGKTTLAHMVARHAGYNVVEVNASDDRNVDSFKTALENATQMKSVIDKEGRPNCLVFDEIDGAPAAAIDYLIKFINGTVKTTKPKKGKKQKPSILKRPIICICNDVYVPALRPLRQIAFILNFPPTASVKLADRLKEICKHQKIQSNTGAMVALSEKTNNDIRACLSVLHFFKTKNIPVTLSEVNKANIGQKDMQKGLFTVWQEIFEMKRSKRGDDNLPMSTRMKDILNTVISFGDYERLAQGVFENYPLIKHKGSDLRPICTAAEWFSYSDCMSRKINETQNYTMNSYMPYGFVMWHFVFASYTRKKIVYPSIASEVHSKTLKQNGIVAEILRGIPSHIRSYVSADSLRLDILPMFNEILVPNLRTINVSLYAPHEKIQINNVVDIMIDYNLTFVQERNAEGNYLFYIDPNIDEVTLFQGLKVQRKTLSYTSKQMLSREIEREKMKRLEKGTNCRVTEEQTPSPSVNNKKDNIENVVPNHLQRLKAKPVSKAKEIVCKDFFGRIITKPVKPKWGDKGHSNDIWFKYKEGYNNAVKRKVTLTKLLN